MRAPAPTPLFVFVAAGRSEDFQLGTGNGGHSADNSSQKTPQVVQALQDMHVADIAAGEDHSVSFGF